MVVIGLSVAMVVVADIDTMTTPTRSNALSLAAGCGSVAWYSSLSASLHEIFA